LSNFLALTQELSQRQPVMNGLLSIFRMAHQFDISLLSLPLLLLPGTYFFFLLKA